MSPQGDLIQLSLSCNGRYINPKGGSSRPRCQPFLQKLQHWTNRAVNWVNCTSQTPGFKDAPLGRVQLPSSGGSGTGYGFLNFSRQTINHSPWPCMGHTNNFQSSGWGCQILPWSWDSKSRLIGISQGGRYKRGVSSENQVWEGQNGAMRRRRAPLTFTLHSTAGISFIGGNAYRLTFGHGWANASMPRVVGKLRENQSGHWDDSWEAKRSTSALPLPPEGSFLGSDFSLDKEEEGVEWTLVLLAINCLRAVDCVLEERLEFLHYRANRFPKQPRLRPAGTPPPSSLISVRFSHKWRSAATEPAIGRPRRVRFA